MCVCVCVQYTSKKVSVLLSTVEYSNSTFCNINSRMHSMCMCTYMYVYVYVYVYMHMCTRTVREVCIFIRTPPLGNIVMVMHHLEEKYISPANLHRVFLCTQGHV